MHIGPQVPHMTPGPGCIKKILWFEFALSKPLKSVEMAGTLASALRCRLTSWPKFFRQIQDFRNPTVAPLEALDEKIQNM